MAAIIVTSLVAVVCFIVFKLTAAVLREYKQFKGVKREIAYLKYEMSNINDILANMDGMEELDVQQNERKSKLQELSNDLEECIDLFKYHLAELEDKAGFTVQLKTLSARHSIAKKIKNLKARLEDESRRRERYIFINESTTMPNQPPRPAIDPRLSALHGEDIGIHRSKRKIIRWLTEEGAGASQQVKVLSIVGCGGIGKTTLTKRVYREIKGQFDCSVFVSVSRKPDIKCVLKEVLYGVGHEGNVSLHTEYLLIDKLREYLKEKRYLIVIDEIWSEEAWNNIRCAFLENNRKSRVIITTRHHDVASACLQACNFHGRVYKVKPLEDADSRRLFFRRLFNFEDGCPEHLRSTSEQILKKCGGVPLVILTLAGTLAHQNVMLIENWEKMLNSLDYGLDTNPDLETMKRILSLSYRDLCPNLRTCMLYLRMFPEDLIIDKNDLVRRWIAEGFLRGGHGCTPEEIAESYFNQLVNRSMIQVVDSDGHGQAISCRVHDVMLDFIMSKAMEENHLFAIVNSQQITRESRGTRRACFHVDHTECDRVISSVDFSNTRSLDFWSCPKCRPYLPWFQLLRVLHLKISDSGYFIICDLTIICKLYLLRYLKITGCNVMCRLPRQIRTLRYLKTLDVNVNLQSFPEDVCEVTSLSNISVVSSPPPTLPNGIGRLSALQTLKAFSVGYSEENIKGLGDLSNLKELELHVDAPDHVQVAAVTSISKLHRLHSLIIHCGGATSRSNFGLHLRYWSPPRGLQKLHLHDCFFNSIPDHWSAQLCMLTSLVLGVWGLSSHDLDVLAGLPSLVHLRLSIMGFIPLGANWTVLLPDVKMPIRRDMFYSLKSFWFRSEVPCDLVFEPGAMPNLESFCMRFLAESVVRTAPAVLVGIQHLRSLESFTAHIDSCSSENNNFIDFYNRGGYQGADRIWSLQEIQWWAYAICAEFALWSAIWHCSRLRVHIKYGT